METYTRSEQSQQIPQAAKFKMETPETIRTSLQKGEWVTSIDFKDAYFHIPIQKQSRKYLRFHVQGKTYQFKALPFVLSTAPLVFTVVTKEVKLMALQKGIRIHQYKLVPAYTNTSSSLSGPRLASKHGKIRTGPQANLRLCRLPVPPETGQGEIHPGLVADTDNQNQRIVSRTNLSGPAPHVPHRAIDGNRKTVCSKVNHYTQ